MPRNKFSMGTFLLVLVLYSLAIAYYSKWKDGTKSGDPLGYYTYLPAAFLYQDLVDLKETNMVRGKYHPLAFNEQFYEDQFLVNVSKQGSKVIKYTCGIAITIAPFFALAHWLAPFFGQATDGFAPIYAFFQYFSGFFYALWGLYLLRGILLKWFEDRVVAWTLLLIALGTNLFFFVSYHAVMAHATLFFLHVLLIHQTVKLYESQRWRNAIGLGISLGLIILIRPVEIVIVFVPLFWGIRSLKPMALKERFEFFIQHKYKIAAVFLTTICMGLPQIWYWFHLTGDFIYYSYGNEGFNFTKPKIIKGLFSYSNGWLAYTPIMYFALLGLFFIRKKTLSPFPIILFLLPHIYLTYSWWVWYYSNGFGSRPMVETYGLLSIPFAAYWVFIKDKKWLFYSSVSLAVFFIYLNIFQSWQFYKGLFRSEASHFEFYLSTMTKTQLDYEDLILYDCGEWQPKSTEISLLDTLYFNDFEKKDSLTTTNKVFKFGENSYKMGTPKRLILIKKPIQELSLEKGDYIKVNFWASKSRGMARMYASAIVSIRFESTKGKGLKTRRMRIDNKITNPENSFWGHWEANDWGEVHFYSHVPRLPKDAVLEVFIEYGSNLDIYLDNLSVEVWRPK